MPTTGKPTHAPQIKSEIEGYEPPEYYEDILKRLFDTCIVVILEEKFEGGFGGGIVLRVSLINWEINGRWPMIVKLGPARLITHELMNYRRYIEDRLPYAIGIKKHYVDEKWGGLSYDLAGHGVSPFENLFVYCLNDKTKVADILAALHQHLFPILRTLHKFRRTVPMLMQSSYDKILPVNLVIKPLRILQDEIQGEEALFRLTPDTIRPELKEGAFVYLEGFQITEIEAREEKDTSSTYSVTVNTPFNSFVLPSFRIRIMPLDDVTALSVGDEMPPIQGVIMQTRNDFLVTEANNAFDELLKFSYHLKMIQFDHKILLPNPLLSYSRILQKFRRDSPVWVGTVHGDLNLHNILIYLASKTISIIDHAAAREDHLLHDFLRLETGIVTKVVAHIISTRPESKYGILYQFYINLHQVCTEDRPLSAEDWIEPVLEMPFSILRAIRKEAQAYLADSKDWTEYYECLVLYLLGTLKFSELNRSSKQLAMIGAASLVDLMENSSDSDHQLRIPERVFIELNAILQAGEQRKIDGVMVVLVKPNCSVCIKVYGAGFTLRDVDIAADQLGQITFTADRWDPEALPIKPQNRWPQNPWPHGRHHWTSRRLRLNDEFRFGEGRTYSFETCTSKLRAVWWVTHEVTFANQDKVKQRFLILVVK